MLRPRVVILIAALVLLIPALFLPSSEAQSSAQSGERISQPKKKAKLWKKRAPHTDLSPATVIFGLPKAIWDMSYQSPTTIQPASAPAKEHLRGTTNSTGRPLP